MRQLAMRILGGCLLAFASAPAFAAVIAGPNSFGGNIYYLLSKNSWSGSETESQSLGGHLATVNSAAENQFLVDTFVVNGHLGNPLWIGLTDQASEGVFAWASGAPVIYTNWQPGEPNDQGGNEDCRSPNT